MISIIETIVHKLSKKMSSLHMYSFPIFHLFCLTKLQHPVLRLCGNRHSHTWQLGVRNGIQFLWVGNGRLVLEEGKVRNHWQVKLLWKDIPSQKTRETAAVEAKVGTKKMEIYLFIYLFI